MTEIWFFAAHKGLEYGKENALCIRHSAIFLNISKASRKGPLQDKSHPSYPRLGDIYMYGAIYLEKEYKADKIIELYKKALELRAEPNSNYALATRYKVKYDDAVKKNDLDKEKEYGKKVYEYLNQYIILSGNKSSKYTEILEYFSAYK